MPVEGSDVARRVCYGQKRTLPRVSSLPVGPPGCNGLTGKTGEADYRRQCQKTPFFPPYRT
jgi:hypothetical protein